MIFFKRYHPLGIALCSLVGALGIFLATLTPIDAVTLSILCGAIIGNTTPVPAKWSTGINWTEKKILGVAIALYGLKLDFALLAELGFKSIFMIMGTIVLTLLLSKPLGRQLKLDQTLSILIGIGTAICGSAAIAATKDIVKADETQAGLSVAVINFIGTIGIFALPILGIEVLALETVDHGFMLGNSLQAVGQVVAAGFSVDDSTGQIATIVKMGRVMMLTPLLFILLRLYNKEKPKEASEILIPKFVIGFLVCSMLATFQFLSKDTISLITDFGKILLIISMGGIGLKISVAKIRNTGLSALAAALLFFLLQLSITCALIRLF